MSEQRVDIEENDPVDSTQLAATEVTKVVQPTETEAGAARDPIANAASDIDNASDLIASLVEDVGRISKNSENDSATLEQFRESMEVVNTQVFELRGYLTRIERNHEAQFGALQELIESQSRESENEQSQNLLLGQLKTIIETRFDRLESKLATLEDNQTVAESPGGTRITNKQNALFKNLEERLTDTLIPRIAQLVSKNKATAEDKEFSSERLEKEMQELRYSLHDTLASLRSELTHNARHVEHIARQTRSSNENSNQASRWRLEMGSKVDALEHLVKEIIRELERSSK